MPHDPLDLVKICVPFRYYWPTVTDTGIAWHPSPAEEFLRQVSNAIAYGKIRQALIGLGWTPPVEDAKS